MKTLSTLAIVLTFSLSALAATRETKSMYCEGGAYRFNVRYVLALSQMPEVKAALLLNGQALATDFASNASATPTRVDDNGHVLEYGQVIAPTRFVGFNGADMYEIRTEDDRSQAVLLKDGGRELTTLNCRVYNY